MKFLQQFMINDRKSAKNNDHFPFMTCKNLQRKMIKLIVYIGINVFFNFYLLSKSTIEKVFK